MKPQDAPDLHEIEVAAIRPLIFFVFIVLFILSFFMGRRGSGPVA